jgi:type VI secretion system Hcp family effector
MTSAFVLPRTRVLAAAVAAALLALVAWQLTAARSLNTSGATAGVVHITMMVTGSRTGQFKGDDGAAPGTRGSIITVLAYSYGLQNSMTIGSGTGGAGAGKVTQKPLTITHTMGGSSPEFLGAAASGERLTSVVINFFRTDKSGKEVTFYRVTLTNAFVSEVSQRSSGDTVLEDVSFIFQKIEQKSLTQNTTFIENLATGGA